MFSPVLFRADCKYMNGKKFNAVSYLLSDAVSRIKDLDPPCEGPAIVHRLTIDIRFLFKLDRRGPVIC